MKRNRRGRLSALAARLAVAALVIGVFVATSLRPRPRAVACTWAYDPFEDRCPSSSGDRLTVIRVLRGSEEFAVQDALLDPVFVTVAGDASLKAFAPHVGPLELSPFEVP